MKTVPMFAVLSVVILMTASPAAAEGQTICSNNFESGCLDGWSTIVNGTDNYFKIIDSDAGKVLAARSPKERVSSAYGWFKTTEIAGDYTVKMKFKLSTDNMPADDFHWLYVLRSHDINLVADQPVSYEGKKYMTLICRHEDAFNVPYGIVGDVNSYIAVLEFDKWYDITITVNSAHKTYDVYLDGKFAQTCKLADIQALGKNEFTLGDDERGLPGQGLNSGQAMWDNLVISAGIDPELQKAAALTLPPASKLFPFSNPEIIEKERPQATVSTVTTSTQPTVIPTPEAQPGFFGMLRSFFSDLLGMR